MSSPIKTLTVSGYPSCENLDYDEKSKVIEMICGDWSLGRFVETPIGRIDRHTNPTLTIEID